MIKTRERLVWVVVVLAVVVWGSLRGGGDGGTDGKISEGGRKPNVAPSAGRDRGEDGGLRGERPPRDEEGLRKYANHALSAPSRTERFKRVMIMVDEVTPDNWQTIWTEYIRQSLAEGRFHEAEWGLFMNRVGEVAGPDAMEYFTHNGQNEYTFNRREILAGWAAQDPQGAWRWLQSQPDDKRPPEFWQSVLNGAAAKDPKIALGWLAEAPAEIAVRVAPAIVGSQIQADGMAGTIASLEEMVAATPQGQQPAPFLAAFYKELASRVSRMKWLGAAYPDVPAAALDLGKLEAVFGSGAPQPPGSVQR
ncbi:hypothetical protein OVA24_18250 [Luteolibacter sp. SL250]|uniref:hypothetical protein n=1 Tax=Luteolibacter sp. SL250 TaxID=2995170 RepID=UPI00226E6E81|nr:hypothetical protein [Luteolibacter sp. SL250]WAC19172.1 hypothetical protein OVA24_18250 [Luteolibacter sp. SL250]